MREKLKTVHAKLQNTINAFEADRSIRDNPGDVTTASKAALDRLKDLLVFFETNWLDSKGNVIKIGWFKWIFNGKLRKKVTEMFDEVLDTISDIVGGYK